MQQTLVLDQGYQPHRVVSWQRAVVLVFGGKVEVVETYDVEVRSPSVAVKVPAVVRLKGRARRPHQRVRFSRMNVALRDDFTCQYCRARLPLGKLTFDHVVPRSQGGATCWQNIVMACAPCNARKAGRTPAQAGMDLRAVPEQPRFLPAVVPRLDTRNVPAAWASWLYWTSPLAP